MVVENGIMTGDFRSPLVTKQNLEISHRMWGILTTVLFRYFFLTGIFNRVTQKPKHIGSSNFGQF